MALNWTMLDSQRSPIPLPHELIIRTVSAAEVTVSVPNAPPTSSSTSGGSGGEKKLVGNGKIWLTDNRVHLPRASGTVTMYLPICSLVCFDLAHIRSPRCPRKKHRISRIRLTLDPTGVDTLHKVRAAVLRPELPGCGRQAVS